VCLMEVRNLNVSLRGSAFPILKSIHVKIKPHCITALIGESGSGKTIFSRTISGLLPENMVIDSGFFYFKHKKISYQWIQKNRGRTIFYTPQNAAASLNPIIKIKTQLKEVSRSGAEPIDKILNNLSLRDSQRILNAYPFELSGGENQRCLLAMAIALTPQLLILDEPVTSVDGQFQKSFIGYIQKIKSKYHMTILMITHNLALIEHIADYIYIMYGGQIVESGTFDDLICQPRHAYTKEIVSYL